MQIELIKISRHNIHACIKIWGQLFKASSANELVKRSTCYVLYDFIIKYTDIFCWKNERSFCTVKASHIFSKKNLGVDINVWNFNETLTNDIVSFEQPGPEMQLPWLLCKIRNVCLYKIKKLTMCHFVTNLKCVIVAIKIILFLVLLKVG